MAPSIVGGVGSGEEDSATAPVPASPEPALASTSANATTSASQSNGDANGSAHEPGDGGSDSTGEGAESGSDCSTAPDPHDVSDGDATAGEAAGPGLGPEDLPGPGPQGEAPPADDGLALLLGEGALARALAGDAAPYEPLPETEEERDAFEAEFAAALASLGPIGTSGGGGGEPSEQAEEGGQEDGQEEGQAVEEGTAPRPPKPSRPQRVRSPKPPKGSRQPAPPLPLSDKYEYVWSLAARSNFDLFGNSTAPGACRRLLGEPSEQVLKRSKCGLETLYSWVPALETPRYVDIRFEAEQPTITAGRVSGVKIFLSSKGVLDPIVSSIELVLLPIGSTKSTRVAIYTGGKGQAANLTCPGFNLFSAPEAGIQVEGASAQLATVLGLRLNINDGPADASRPGSSVHPWDGLPSISAVALVLTPKA
ncbi:hypothetical protein HYH03_001813 [Edaphochlamys debaryana]|uniref:Uncharacterized protein n=1 Tax=Edaphochlamys debaryana TaxID=47281 RepID=A0A835YC66_9CHLO|nr:hypothetical protein HYH03_001813 [Edaphochlamys debaryana]|eukprot:KAG2500235.1 hypothetical protein HYH03_001813 [Edaphochlamys debaryana]